jgi:hypothetical protein
MCIALPGIRVRLEKRSIRGTEITGVLPAVAKHPKQYASLVASQRPSCGNATEKTRVIGAAAAYISNVAASVAIENTPVMKRVTTRLFWVAKMVDLI